MRRRTKPRPPICRMSSPQARTVRRAKHPKQGTRIALLSRRIPTRALAVGLVENLPTPTHILCRGESHLGLVLLVTNHSSELSSLWCSTKLAQKLKQVSYAVHFMALGAHSQPGAPMSCGQSGFCSGEAAVRHAGLVHEEARGDDAEEESADVGEVGDAAGADLGDRAEVEDLHQKPEADEERRRE